MYHINHFHAEVEWNQNTKDKFYKFVIISMHVEWNQNTENMFFKCGYACTDIKNPTQTCDSE